MSRLVHSGLGLLASALLSMLAVTGAFLAFESVTERARSTQTARGQQSVARLAELVQSRHPEVERIVRTASGSVIAYYFEGDRAGAELIDPVTGEALAPYEPSPLTRTITNLHRALLMGETGRAIAGAGAAVMMVLCISGAILLVTRSGGWAALVRPSRGTPVQRLHCEVGRGAIVGLSLSALTGCYLSLATFGLVPDGSSATGGPRPTPSGGERLAISHLAALQTVDLVDLRELTFPYGADLTDTYTLTTAQGVGDVDASTGHLLTFVPHDLTRRIHETVFMLHTGRGMWPLALLLGLSALAAPVLAVAGGAIWWRRRRSMPRITRNVGAQAADTIILVGSEGNSTWGFAATLHAALARAGHRVHVAAMNDQARRYGNGRRLLILASTHGDGDAPASATSFLRRLPHATPIPVAVLGFGDRSFPRFCGYAAEVDAALRGLGWPKIADLRLIDRQSAQDFAEWGAMLGAAIGTPLTLVHVAARPETHELVLAERVDYGADSQAPTSILRFVAPPAPSDAGPWRRLRGRRLPRFEAGDLLGIVAPGTDLPRFYSLASSSSDGIVEICVRKRPGGLCSSFLHDLSPGSAIQAFVRTNTGFRPCGGKTPLILIGAGAGIGPLAGFIRHNRRRRPVHLYWGGRHPASDFLYAADIERWLANKHLTRLVAAFSRVPGGAYVQDRLTSDAAEVRSLIQHGAQVMVCGGREMAAGVAKALASIVQPLGLDLAGLKAEGRYLEDVY